MSGRVNVLGGLVIFTALCAFVAGCGGGGGTTSSSLPHGGAGSQSGTLATAILRIVIPTPGATLQGRLRRPAYISPSTQQLAYSVDGTSQTPVALSTSNPNCSGSPVTCNVPFYVAPGSHTFTFTLEDTNGAPLSGATNVTSTLTAGTANTLSVTLGGIATQVTVQSQTSNVNRMVGSTSNGFQIYGNAAVQFAVVLYDADGNAIVGTGAPQPSIAPSASAPFTIATPTSGSNVWGLTSTYSPTNPAVPSITGFTVVATPYPNSGTSQTLSASVPVALYQPWIYVVNNGNGTITAYDEQGNLKSTSFTGLSGPFGIALDTSTASPAPYAGYMYVTNANGPSVSAYVPASTATSVPGAFSGLASPAPIVFDPNVNELYVANTTAGSLKINSYSESGLSVTNATILAGATALAYDSVDHQIFLATSVTSPSNVFTITSFSETLVQQTQWTTSLNKPSGLAYDPNNGWIYVANKGNGTITAYNKSGTQQTLSGFSGLSAPVAMLFDPYSNVFYVTDGNAMKAFSEAGSSVTLSGFGSLNGPASMVLLP